MGEKSKDISPNFFSVICRKKWESFGQDTFITEIFCSFIYSFIYLFSCVRCAELLVMKAELELMKGAREESRLDLDKVRNLLEICSGLENYFFMFAISRHTWPSGKGKNRNQKLNNFWMIISTTCNRKTVQVLLTTPNSFQPITYYAAHVNMFASASLTKYNLHFIDTLNWEFFNCSFKLLNTLYMTKCVSLLF